MSLHKSNSYPGNKETNSNPADTPQHSSIALLSPSSPELFEITALYPLLSLSGTLSGFRLAALGDDGLTENTAEASLSNNEQEKEEDEITDADSGSDKPTATYILGGAALAGLAAVASSGGGSSSGGNSNDENENTETNDNNQPPVNNTPIAANDYLFTDQNTNLSLTTLTANDSDEDGDPLTILSVDTTETEGTVTLLPEGEISYQPGGKFRELGAEQSQTDTFTYTISDGKGGESTATVTVEIAGLNDRPNADYDYGEGFTTNEDTTFTTENVLENDSDPDLGDNIDVSDLDTDDTLGLVQNNGDGTFNYNPLTAFDYLPAGSVAEDQFRYTISDEYGESDDVLVTITITGVNDNASISGIDGGGVTEDGNTTTGGTLSVNDVDLGENFFKTPSSLAGTYGSFSFNPSTGAWGYVLNNNANIVQDLNEDDVTYDRLVVESADGTASKTIEVSIYGENDFYNAIDDEFAVSETGLSNLDILANDFLSADPGDAAITSVSMLYPNDTVSIDNLTNRVVFNPGTGFEALDEGQTATVRFLYSAQKNGQSDEATVTVHVQGEGQFESARHTDSDSGLLGDSQNINLTLETSTETNNEEDAIKLNISASSGVKTNILYILDTSDSTQTLFDNSGFNPDYDVNNDSEVNTILDAELRALLNLTTALRNSGVDPEDVSVTVIPFSHVVDDNDVATFSLDDTGLDDHLRSLTHSGVTNFEAPLQRAETELSNLPDGNNLIYFFSDGNAPGEIDDELDRLETNYDAQIQAFGLFGYYTYSSTDAANLTSLNKIDNTGGAVAVRYNDNFDQLLQKSPIPADDVADLSLFVNDVLVDDIDANDLVESALGLALNVTVDELAPYTGQSNEVVAEVTFDSGFMLEVSLDIDGALPLSTDPIV